MVLIRLTSPWGRDQESDLKTESEGRDKEESPRKTPGRLQNTWASTDRQNGFRNESCQWGSSQVQKDRHVYVPAGGPLCKKPTDRVCWAGWRNWWRLWPRPCSGSTWLPRRTYPAPGRETSRDSQTKRESQREVEVCTNQGLDWAKNAQGSWSSLSPHHHQSQIVTFDFWILRLDLSVSNQPQVKLRKDQSKSSASH